MTRHRTILAATILSAFALGFVLMQRAQSPAEELPAGSAVESAAEPAVELARPVGRPLASPRPVRTVASPSAATADPAQERSAQRRVLEPPQYHPRPASEWQGMPVDTTVQAYCEGESSCGLGLACIDNVCGACTLDADCASGEACVLDHCVAMDNVACRSASDCGSESLCMLSGYSSGIRGNEDMTAQCVATSGGDEREYEPEEVSLDVRATPRPVSISELFEPLEDDAEVDTFQ